MKNIIIALFTITAIGCTSDATKPSDAKQDTKTAAVQQPTVAKPTSLDSHLSEAKAYLAKSKLRTDLVVLIDFSLNSAKPRLFVVDLKTNAIESYHVAHGKGSDANNDGMAEKFSNVPGSDATSLGFYKTAETYIGKHGLSLKMDGLEATNSNARARSVVIHPADYVYEANKQAGRSWGCFALAPSVAPKLIEKLKGGVLIYAYAK